MNSKIKMKKIKTNFSEIINEMYDADESDRKLFTYYDQGGYAHVMSVGQFLNASLSVINFSKKNDWTGKVVAILQENNFDVPPLLCGLLAAGVTVLPINPKNPPSDIVYILTHAAACAVIIESTLALNDSEYPDLRILLNQDIFDKSTTCIFDKKIEKISTGGMYLYTSGTTSKPKCVNLSQSNLLANATAVIKHFKLHASRQMTTLPLYHAHALGFGLLSSLLSQGHLIFMAGMHPLRWPKIALMESVEWTSVVPSLLPLLNHMNINRKSHPDLKGILVSSAPLQAQFAIDFESKTSIPIIQGWGQTEFTNFATIAPLASSERDLCVDGIRTAGIALADTTIVVVNDWGEEVAEGVVGELHLKGSSLMLGYRDQSGELEKNTTLLGHPTGDLGFRIKMKEGDHFFITGRCKELIIRGAEKISPLAIEEAVRVAVDNSAFTFVAVGYNHAYLGQEIGLYVQANGMKLSTIEEVLQAVFYMHDAVRPKIIIVDEEIIPRTFTGKIKRNQLVILFKSFEQYQGKTKIVDLRQF